jgi:hypothetical protein
MNSNGVLNSTRYAEATLELAKIKDKVYKENFLNIFLLFFNKGI